MRHIVVGELFQRVHDGKVKQQVMRWHAGSNAKVVVHTNMHCMHTMHPQTRLSIG